MKTNKPQKPANEKAPADSKPIIQPLCIGCQKKLDNAQNAGLCTITKGKDFYVFQYSEMLLVNSKDHYSTLYFGCNQNPSITWKDQFRWPLNTFSHLLDLGFYQVNRNQIINLRHLKCVLGDGTIHLHHFTHIPISLGDSHRPMLLEQLARWHVKL